MKQTMELLKTEIQVFLQEYGSLDVEKLLNKRYDRFKKL